MAYYVAADQGVDYGVRFSVGDTPMSMWPYARPDLSRLSADIDKEFPSLGYGEYLPPAAANLLPKHIYFHLQGARAQKFRPADARPGDLFVASARLIELIEEYEPGIHQYFPVEVIIFEGDKRSYMYSDYFILNVLKAFEGFEGLAPEFLSKNLEQQEVRGSDGRLTIVQKVDLNQREMIFDRQCVGGVHLWRTVSRFVRKEEGPEILFREQVPRGLFCSEEIKSAILEKKVKGFHFEALKL